MSRIREQEGAATKGHERHEQDLFLEYNREELRARKIGSHPCVLLSPLQHLAVSNIVKEQPRKDAKGANRRRKGWGSPFTRRWQGDDLMRVALPPTCRVPLPRSSLSRAHNEQSP
jgi:hypothetical protein